MQKDEPKIAARDGQRKMQTWIREGLGCEGGEWGGYPASSG